MPKLVKVPEPKHARFASPYISKSNPLAVTGPQGQLASDTLHEVPVAASTTDQKAILYPGISLASI